MYSQLELPAKAKPETLDESPRFLTEQLITYIGNKRNLLNFIGLGLARVQKRLGKSKLDTFDVFSGSGVVSRFLKQYSNNLITNDLEKYACLINQCYLTNKDTFDDSRFREIYDDFSWKIGRAHV